MGSAHSSTLHTTVGRKAGRVVPQQIQNSCPHIWQAAAASCSSSIVWWWFCCCTACHSRKIRSRTNQKIRGRCSCKFRKAFFISNNGSSWRAEVQPMNWLKAVRLRRKWRREQASLKGRQCLAFEEKAGTPLSTWAGTPVLQNPFPLHLYQQLPLQPREWVVNNSITLNHPPTLRGIWRRWKHSSRICHQKFCSRRLPNAWESGNSSLQWSQSRTPGACATWWEWYLGRQGSQRRQRFQLELITSASYFNSAMFISFTKRLKVQR